ncbi:unnamed protein product [marine sediment metagenome]|uniref:ABC transporter permease n=1 Tax=marine sediment metagenome TaxID=412755 RepID=X0X8T7_9ZZZZ
MNVAAGVSKLLAGIIMMTVLYSVNLRIMGRSNYSLLNLPSMFDWLSSSWGVVAMCCIIASVVFFILWYLLRTEFGFFLRAAGENPTVVTRSGISVGVFTVIGLAMANALIAFGGGLLAQIHGFADIGMGTGLIVIALASLLIGEAVLAPRSVPRLLAAAIVGSWLYQFVLAIGLRLGMDPRDLKLTTGVLLAAAVVFRKQLTRSRADESIGCSVL